ncbi:uncharacterized protein LOC141606623 isoform X2 [Silene latifolia]|uniref:uncharacterized protein LOC141606623 isoform X2 n=1 Tax=Silene latifolia TaxID=37657 RepID=UPI003D7859AB
MEEICDKVCVFEESLEIDFDFEFDVEKFFDFTSTETIDEVMESERWFHLAPGYPPSPLLLKLGLVTEEYEHQYESAATSDNGESETRDQCKRQGSELLKPKPANQTRLSTNSRLLQPTASQLAKQNQQIGFRETRPPASVQKLGSSVKSPGSIAATKRHKLQYGYLHKVAQLKHQTNFAHKLARQTASTSETSCHARPKTSAPKEICLGTANRAQQRRSQDASELVRDAKYDSCTSRSRLSNGKASEPKKNTPSLALVIKGLKKSASRSMKENKNPNSAVVKPTTCCLKQNQTSEGRVTVIAY